VRGAPKEPKAEPLQSDSNQLITWSLEHVDFKGLLSCGDVPDGYCGWTTLAAMDLAQLHADLVAVAKRKIRLLRHDQKLRSIPFDSLRREAQDRLTTMELADERMHELRFGEGRRRVWGFLYGSTFHLVWWDPKHKVCRGKDRRR
jgi:hypothetical protein